MCQIDIDVKKSSRQNKKYMPYLFDYWTILDFFILTLSTLKGDFPNDIKPLNIWYTFQKTNWSEHPQNITGREQLKVGATHLSGAKIRWIIEGYHKRCRKLCLKVPTKFMGGGFLCFRKFLLSKKICMWYHDFLWKIFGLSAEKFVEGTFWCFWVLCPWLL